jgi:hypothetical protein
MTLTFSGDPSKGHSTPKTVQSISQKVLNLPGVNFDPIISIKSPLKVLGDYSYSYLIPFLPFARCLDRDKDGRDEGCGDEVRNLLAVVSPYKPWIGGLVRAHPRPLNSPWTHELELHTHFITRLYPRLALSHILTQNSTSTLLLEHERHSTTPQKAVTRVPFES